MVTQSSIQSDSSEYLIAIIKPILQGQSHEMDRALFYVMCVFWNRLLLGCFWHHFPGAVKKMFLEVNARNRKVTHVNPTIIQNLLVVLDYFQRTCLFYKEFQWNVNEMTRCHLGYQESVCLLVLAK